MSWDIRMAVRPGAAQYDAIVQADKKASHRVDPEEETALGADRVQPGPSTEASPRDA